ncbi:hypothetical protein [Lactococcus fujiensis]|uniref:hypothetical protein n=1 Tax=Lactococcus fujiensis TaxID=610251 RepID=UPI000B16B672|nr:hypothetical protein [Lactococcus fujiensis]
MTKNGRTRIKKHFIIKKNEINERIEYEETKKLDVLYLNNTLIQNFGIGMKKRSWFENWEENKEKKSFKKSTTD